MSAASASSVMILRAPNTMAPLEAGGSRLEARRRLEPRALSLEQERPAVILIGALKRLRIADCELRIVEERTIRNPKSEIRNSTNRKVK